MSERRSLLLSIDTATSASSVALTSGECFGGKLIASVVLNSKLTHSRRLLTSIEWMLAESDVTIDDIDGIAVGLGPGSFTGLRIGMATGKGLAMASDKPLLGVSTLDALAFSCVGEKPVCVVLDARKKEVYTAWYGPDADGIMRRKGDIRAILPEQLGAEITEPVLMVGDGVLSYAGIFREQCADYLHIAPLSLHYPTAAAIGFLCAEKLSDGEVLDLGSAAPLYVRASDAELSLVKKMEQGR